MGTKPPTKPPARKPDPLKTCTNYRCPRPTNSAWWFKDDVKNNVECGRDGCNANKCCTQIFTKKTWGTQGRNDKYYWALCFKDMVPFGRKPTQKPPSKKPTTRAQRAHNRRVQIKWKGKCADTPISMEECRRAIRQRWGENMRVKEVWTNQKGRPHGCYIQERWRTEKKRGYWNYWAKKRTLCYRKRGC